MEKRKFSSVGLEHHVYTVRVIGSNPVTSTNGYQSGTRLSETGGNGDNKIGGSVKVGAITASADVGIDIGSNPILITICSVHIPKISQFKAVLGLSE